MALTITSMPRKFYMLKNGKSLELNDANPDFSPEQILSFYTLMYPDLTTATIHGPKIMASEIVYEFKTTIGVKG